MNLKKHGISLTGNSNRSNRLQQPPIPQPQMASLYRSGNSQLPANNTGNLSAEKITKTILTGLIQGNLNDRLAEQVRKRDNIIFQGEEEAQWRKKARCCIKCCNCLCCGGLCCYCVCPAPVVKALDCCLKYV